MPQPNGVWYPTVFPEKCDGCMSLKRPRCVEYCPHGVYELQSGRTVVARPQKCVNGCTACEPICQNRAISFPRRDSAFGSSSMADKGLLRKITCGRCGKTVWTNRESTVCMDCERKQ